MEGIGPRLGLPVYLYFTAENPTRAWCWTYPSTLQLGSVGYRLGSPGIWSVECSTTDIWRCEDPWLSLAAFVPVWSRVSISRNTSCVSCTQGWSRVVQQVLGFLFNTVYILWGNMSNFYTSVPKSNFDNSITVSDCTPGRPTAGRIDSLLYCL